MRIVGQLLRPGWVSLVAFLTLAAFMPIWFVYTEPERTNYLPGEEQVWTTKSKQYPSTFWEYVYHTDGAPDVLLGIIVRNYFSNRIGIGLLLVDYLAAAGVNLAVRRFLLRGRG